MPLATLFCAIQGSSLIDLPAVTERQYQYYQVVVLNVADGSIITNTVTPQALQLMPQGLTKTTGILIGCDAFRKVFQNISLDLPIQPA